MPVPIMAERNSKKRRSQRFPHKVSVVLSSTEPTVDFYESCETCDVSSHGCQVRTQRKLRPGQVVQLRIFEPEQQTRARVMRVRPDLSAMAWEVGLELAEPGNIWGLEFSRHMVHWPADLPAPPIRVATGTSTARDSTPHGVEPYPQREENYLRVRTAAEKIPAKQPADLEPPEKKELEGHLQDVIREVTNRLTKNTQFALHTLEESIREMSDSARGEMKEWWDAQRAEMDREFHRLADASRSTLLRETLEELRRQNQQMLAQGLEEFRARLSDALQASLETLVDRLNKRKLY